LAPVARVTAPVIPLNRSTAAEGSSFELPAVAASTTTPIAAKPR
jgi:hypothetical protein